MNRVSVKTDAEIKDMTEGGKLLGEVKNKLAESAEAGMTTLELDSLADKLIAKTGGKASFKLVPGYKWATCMNVNDVVVHGIPNKYKLKLGDKLGIDVGLFYKGFHTDTSVTVMIGGKETKFLEVGRAALNLAMSKVQVGNRIMDISKAMQNTVEAAGYSAIRALTGHGVGHELHEEPAIPCFVLGKYEHSPIIVAGMVLAVEVMYNEGSLEVVYKNDDGWTIATADGKISGLFEETVAVTKSGPIILTRI